MNRPLGGWTEIRSMAFSPTVDETVEQGLVGAEKASRTIRFAYTSGGLFIMLVGAVLFAMSEPLALFAPFLILFGAITLIMGLGMRSFLVFVTRPHMVGDENANYYVPRTILADARRVRVEYGTGMLLEVPWQSITKVRHQRLTTYLAITKQQTIVVPDRAFPDASSLESFHALCAQKVGDNNLHQTLAR